jgi:methylmalonyl-CoA/ethylmalonyl-CoA epimerase
MIKRLNHVGVIVTNLDDTLKVYQKIFGLKPATVKTAMEGKARVAFVPVGDGEIELIQPLDPNMPQSKFLQTRGQGIHHISLSTDNIESEVDRMKKEGVAFAAEAPRIGAHGVKIIFTKPETTDNITVELCEEP